MFIPMWMMFACRNAAVMSRHQSPFATAGPYSTHFENNEPPGVLIPAPCATVMR